MKLFEQFGFNPDWLKKGSGPMYLRTDQGYTPMDAPANMVATAEDPARYGSGADAKSTIVQVYATQEEDAPSIGRLTVPQSFSEPGLRVIRVSGAGMEPYILKGAYVGLDTTHRRVTSGELYGVRLPYEGLVLKRAFIDTQKGILVLRSENAAHPELFLPLEDYESSIVGRVSWVFQKM